jgi:hypothetical protein
MTFTPDQCTQYISAIIQANPLQRPVSDLIANSFEWRKMPDRVHYHPDLIFSLGTQVVTLIDIPSAGGLPRVNL